MDVVYSIVGKVVEYIISPVERRVRYHFHYRKNIKNLEEQLQILVDARGRVQNMVDDARSNAYNIEDDVLMWLIKVDEIMSQENERKSLEKKCLNMFRQHKLSREAKKKVEVVSKILEKRTNFDKVGYPAPLSRIECSIGDDYQILESRTLIAKKIRDALADDNVNKVGIYGMGGVGKTMLLKEIKRSVKESKLFDHVITVTVSQTWDVKGIQSQIGDILRLRLNEVESKQARAILLRNKLEKGNKILIVLDDVWKELNLEDVGIPCRSKLGEKGCKILITSRDQDVLANEMNTKEYFQVKPLSREESWKFFKNMIGEIDKICIEPIAKDVAKKCAGLPIALTTVAKALKGKNLPIWKDALKQLENPIAVNIKGVSDMVYSSLQLSYDYIKGEEAKFLFLISSVFPYDYKIPLKDLQMYAMGMELLIDVNTWEEARNRTTKLVCDLKSSSLLEEFISRNMMLSTKNYVKMHDVIRDVAKYIASKEVNMSTLSYGYGLSEWREKDKCGNYKAIFVDCHGFHNFPHHLKFTKLELLILCGHRREQKLQIFDTIFEGMEKLKVLDLSGMHFPQLTTSLIHALANLRTLCMSNCKFDDTRIIGELKKLEILKISECPIIELSATMNQLTELKVLSVSKCSLKVIPPNIISSMKKLEELDLWSSFNGWGAEVLFQNKLNKNASLSELNCLPHLTILKLHILDENNLPHLSLTKDLKLERIHIGVGDMNWTRKYRYEATMRWMWLKSDQSETVLNDQVILQACEEVGLEAKKGITNFIFKSNETSYTNLRHLFLGKNSDMQYLIGDHQLE